MPQFTCKQSWVFLFSSLFLLTSSQNRSLSGKEKQNIGCASHIAHVKMVVHKRNTLANVRN